MNQTILDFLASHPVGALTTTLPDGTLHAAALHYSHSDQPFALYFATKKTSRKCQGLLHGETVKAAFVAGLSEEEWKTVQIEGDVRVIVDETERAVIQTIHYTKHPQAEQFKDSPETVFIELKPTWWRYTDFKTKPITIVSSENELGA